MPKVERSVDDLKVSTKFGFSLLRQSFFPKEPDGTLWHLAPGLAMLAKMFERRASDTAARHTVMGVVGLC